MAEDQQVGPGLYVKLGMDLSRLVGAGGASAIVLNQMLDLFNKFEMYGKQAFDNTIGKAIEYQEVIENLHNTLGLTNADAQKWKSTLVSFDTDIGSFSASLRYLTQRVSDTGASGESLRATLKGIGVDAKDATGNYKNASDLMQEILVALGKVPEGTQRANLEVEIYGRNWYNIANLVNNGTLAVQKFKEKQPLFSDDDLERIDKAKIRMGEFSSELNNAGALIGSGIIEKLLDPAFNMGHLAGVEASSFGMGIAGAIQYYQTGNSALTVEAMKRLRDPGAYTQEALAAQEAAAKASGSGSSPPALTIPALLTGPETLQQKLDEITNTTLPKLKQAYLDAIPTGNLEVINSARKAYDDVLGQQFDITHQIRDQRLSYQQIIDVTLPHLKESLDKAKASGLKPDIEAATIALDQGVNSANDLGVALGKAAVSADSIKSAITIGAGWSKDTMIGSAGSEHAAFMIDEMQHGMSPDIAAQAWANGVHSYIHVGGTFGTLGEAINVPQASTRNPGANEREAMAAAGKTTSAAGGAKPAATPGSPEQTKAVSKENDNQLKSLQSLTDGTTKEYQKQTDAFTAHLDALALLRATQYPILETQDLIHHATSEEIARVGEQKMIDYMAEAYNFGGQHTIVQNMVVVSKNGPDWVPPKFTPITSLKLESADFTAVGASVQAIVAKGMGEGTSGTVAGNKAAQDTGEKAKIIIQQTITGVDSTTTNKVTNATASGVNKAMAGVGFLGGGYN